MEKIKEYIKQREKEITESNNRRSGYIPLMLKSIIDTDFNARIQELAKLSAEIDKLSGEKEDILITEEWLEKLGFEKDAEDDSNWWYYQWSEFDLDGWSELGYNTDSLRCGISGADDDDMGAGYLGYPIQYVHQLQNLCFVLTGVNINRVRIDG